MLFAELCLSCSQLCLQELKHYSQAVQDLEQALVLESGNKAFAKELDRLKQDCAEQRKQRAVLKQLDNSRSLSNSHGNSQSSTTLSSSNDGAIPKAAEKPDQAESKPKGPSKAMTDLQSLQKLVTDLQTAGEHRQK